MKKTMFSLLMISAMFMVASCGSKSNSGEATAEGVPSEETATPQYLPADPAITYGDGREEASRLSDGTIYSGKDRENVPLNGCFEIEKVAVVKTTNENRNSSYSYKVVATINLKMIKDYPEKIDIIEGTIQLINKDGAVLAEINDNFTDELEALKVGDVGVISSYKLAEYDADGLVADTKYIRLSKFSAGHNITE